MKKLTKARKSYKCYNCKLTIEKGDKYSKVSVSIGSPGKTDYVNKNGVIYTQMLGFKTSEAICQKCLSKNG